MTIIIATSILVALAIIIGLLLAFSSQKLYVPKDARQMALAEAMPGLNCGACGFPGCEGYAVALNSGKTIETTLCPPGGNATAATLSEILGQKAGEREAEVAFVKCQGSPEYAKSDFHYGGLEDCQAAALMFRGNKSCQYGCLGFGSCVKQCPVDAISISADSLAVVDPELCIGCRKCLPVCPTSVIQMIPATAPYEVICNAIDHGKVTRSNCKVGCIGCRICENKYPELQFKVEQNLASVNFEQLKASPDPQVLAEVMKKCPSKCIVLLQADGQADG